MIGSSAVPKACIAPSSVIEYLPVNNIVVPLPMVTVAPLLIVKLQFTNMVSASQETSEVIVHGASIGS